MTGTLPYTLRSYACLACPATLVATHVYLAESLFWENDTSNCRPLARKRMRPSSLMGIPSLYQVILGKGIPMAGQLKITGRPLMTLGLRSTLILPMYGGTENSNGNICICVPIWMSGVFILDIYS